MCSLHSYAPISSLDDHSIFSQPECHSTVGKAIEFYMMERKYDKEQQPLKSDAFDSIPATIFLALRCWASY